MRPRCVTRRTDVRTPGVMRIGSQKKVELMREITKALSRKETVPHAQVNNLLLHARIEEQDGGVGILEGARELDGRDVLGLHTRTREMKRRRDQRRGAASARAPAETLCALWRACPATPGTAAYCCSFFLPHPQ